MNKWILCAAAMIAGIFTGCSSNEMEETRPDAISVAPGKKTFSSEGGKVKVIVTSSSDWTLEGQYDWITPSSVSGKDGEKITFEVAPNETGEELKADYKFVAGKAEATFSIVSLKKGDEVSAISVYPETLEFAGNGGTESVVVTSEGEWTVEPKEEYDWISAKPVSGEDGDIVEFIASANQSSDPREAIFLFKSGDSELEYMVTMSGSEFFMELISEAEMTIPQAGGEFTVELKTNVPYQDLQYSLEPAIRWVEFVTSLAGDEENTARMVFKVLENSGYASRNVALTIKGVAGTSVSVNIEQEQKDRIEVSEKEYYVPLEGASISIPVTANCAYEVITSDSWIEYKGNSDGAEQFTIGASDYGRQGTVTLKGENIETVVNIVQKKEALIEFVADMNNNWAWPAWDNPAPVNNLSQFTIEMLLNIQDFKSASEVSTLIGIENYFLLRLGNGDNVRNSVLQLAYKGGELELASFTPFHAKEWFHLAVTFDRGEVKFYYNGMLSSSGRINMNTVSFGVPHVPENERNRCFWVGYSYEPARCFNGYMSEVRMWNKVLSETDLKETNHFYSVDPASEGLVAYWKFNEGKPGTIKDWSTSGNDMSVQSSMRYVKVSLP